MSRESRRDPSKEQFWRDLLSAQARSGQTIRAFCRQRQVAEPGFYAWRRELKLRGRETPAFAAVTLRTDESRLAFDELEIRLSGGDRIRFRGGCSAELLGKAVALLGRRLC